jgi:hypothetical protein
MPTAWGWARAASPPVFRLGGLGSAVFAAFTMHYYAFLRAARWMSADTFAAKTRAWRLQVVADRVRAGVCL